MRLLCIFVLLFGSACSASRVIKPLDDGELRVSLDLGGPLANNQPLPLSSLSLAYGATDKVSVFAGVHPSAALFQTILVDAGVTWEFFEQKGPVPGLSFTGAVYPIYALRDGAFRLYPETTAHAYWQIGQKHLLYAGLMIWWDWHVGQNDLGGRNFIEPSLQTGYRFLGERWLFGAELKYLNFDEQLLIPQVKVNSFGTGGIGIYLTTGLRFGHNRSKGGGE